VVSWRCKKQRLPGLIWTSVEVSEYEQRLPITDKHHLYAGSPDEPGAHKLRDRVSLEVARRLHSFGLRIGLK
jgi:hypothetical protein